MPKGWVRRAPGTSILVNTPSCNRNPWGKVERGRVALLAVRADDLPLIVDPRGEGRLGAGEIDHGEGLFVPQETMQSSSVIDVAAHGPAAVIDAEGHGVQAGAGASMVVKTSPSAHKAMAPDADIVLVLAGSHLSARAEAAGSDCCRLRRCPRRHKTDHSERCENCRRRWPPLHNDGIFCCLLKSY